MQPSDVIEFWFDPASRSRWFESTPEFDREVEERFGGAYRQATAGELDPWQDSAEGCLALCLLLDQFPRNLFRGSREAFATDAQALAIAEHALARGFDQQLPPGSRMFLYLPFEHSENRAHQARAVELIGTLGNAQALDYAIRHLRVIERFGRFPHRNQALGRETTQDEAAFLREPGSSF